MRFTGRLTGRLTILGSGLRVREQGPLERAVGAWSFGVYCISWSRHEGGLDDPAVRAATLWLHFWSRGDCPIMGLGSFGTLAFWSRKRVGCMGPHIPKVRPPVDERYQSSVEE